MPPKLPITGTAQLLPKPRELRARQTIPAEKQVLRFPDVMVFTTLGRTAIWRLVSDGDFPPPFRLGKRIWAWHRADIEQFLAGRPAKQSRHSTEPTDVGAEG